MVILYIVITIYVMSDRGFFSEAKRLKNEYRISILEYRMLKDSKLHNSKLHIQYSIFSFLALYTKGSAMCPIRQDM